jgi:hypothetical protein
MRTSIRRGLFTAALLGLVVAGANQAEAALINYTLEGDATGVAVDSSANVQPFSGHFTITLMGDTANADLAGGTVPIVTGFTSLEYSIPTLGKVFSDNVDNSALINLASANKFAFFVDNNSTFHYPDNSPLKTYDFTTELAPVSLTSLILNLDDHVTGGPFPMGADFTLQSFTNVTFSATFATPEPSALASGVGGIVMILAGRWLRRRVSTAA